MSDNKEWVVGKLVQEKAQVHKDRTFMFFKDEQITYDELDRFSNRCAGQRCGVQVRLHRRLSTRTQETSHQALTRSMNHFVSSIQT